MKAFVTAYGMSSASVAVQLSVFLPMAKVDPDGGVQLTLPSVVSPRRPRWPCRSPSPRPGWWRWR
jgi:hypothetical protein